LSDGVVYIMSGSECCIKGAFLERDIRGYLKQIT